MGNQCGYEPASQRVNGVECSTKSDIHVWMPWGGDEGTRTPKPQARRRSARTGRIGALTWAAPLIHSRRFAWVLAFGCAGSVPVDLSPWLGGSNRDEPNAHHWRRTSRWAGPLEADQASSCPHLFKRDPSPVGHPRLRLERRTSRMDPMFAAVLLLLAMIILRK